MTFRQELHGSLQVHPEVPDEGPKITTGFHDVSVPICSMGLVYLPTLTWTVVFMVNVCEFTMHGCYGILFWNTTVSWKKSAKQPPGMYKPCKSWDRVPINWISAINSTLPELTNKWQAGTSTMNESMYFLLEMGGIFQPVMLVSRGVTAGSQTIGGGCVDVSPFPTKLFLVPC